MRRTILTFLLALGLSATGTFFLLWGPGGVLSPSEPSEDVIIILEKGSSLKEIAHNLDQAKVIRCPWSFMAGVVLSGNKGALKAGEYLIPAHARPWDIIRILVGGKVVVHQVTIPEGLMVNQILDIIKNLPHLTGDIIRIPEEGYLLPETYYYVRGDSREKLISHMYLAMKQALEKIWETKKQGLPLKDAHELLTLASIVEKETGVPHERTRVASVFINRLVKGMKLQSDPTVIYGLTLGKKPLGRLLTLRELKHDSVYNTYMILGLPPKPIACPGLESLQAVGQPALSNDYYFVADGTGGHAFSTTYEKHLENVRQWRKIQGKS